MRPGGAWGWRSSPNICRSLCWDGQVGTLRWADPGIHRKPTFSLRKDLAFSQLQIFPVYLEWSLSYYSQWIMDFKTLTQNIYTATDGLMFDWIMGRHSLVNLIHKTITQKAGKWWENVHWWIRDEEVYVIHWWGDSELRVDSQAEPHDLFWEGLGRQAEKCAFTEDLLIFSHLSPLSWCTVAHN